jgi:hypothetical protein
MAEKKEYIEPKVIVVEPYEDGLGSARYRLPYGIAKGMGLNTDGMTPREVWEMLKGKGVNPDNAYKELEKKAKTEIKEEEPVEVDGCYPDKQRTKIYQFRAEHQKKTHEFATVLDENGNTLVYREGNIGSVGFTRNETSQFKGKSLSHNHPQGNTFLSDADIQMLVYKELRTIEAIGYDGYIHTIEVLPKENPEMVYGVQKRLLEFLDDYEKALKSGTSKARQEWAKQPKVEVKTGRYIMKVPQNWSLYRKGASPRDGMNWNEYAKIVQNEIIEFSKTTKEKYGIVSIIRKGGN